MPDLFLPEDQLGMPAIKIPAMVDTLQPAPLINPPFRQWSQPMSTSIIKHLPFTFISIPPHNHIKNHYPLGMRLSLVKITDWANWIPL